ncbi:MAG: flagellar hook-basal body complex protein FliE [Pseudolabrys sp.]|nr:flagellar hook-basal body complex protein FliE [Pseudolabrys sp.]
MASPIAATNAYAAMARLADPSGAAGVAKSISGGADGGSFGQMLSDALHSVAETGRRSDVQARGMAQGKADLVNVVTAVSETEVAIDAVVAVRDRVIQAYEDIMKMPI